MAGGGQTGAAGHLLGPMDCHSALAFPPNVDAVAAFKGITRKRE